jgi:hypothetical protein
MYERITLLLLMEGRDRTRHLPALRRSLRVNDAVVIRRDATADHLLHLAGFDLGRDTLAA